MFSTIITSHSPPPFERPWGNYLLEKIVENQAPDAISWLPQTVGWKILAIIIIFYFLKKSYQGYRNYQRNAYRRDAIKWLEQCQQSDELENFKQFPALIRQTALFAFSRTEVSQLSGSQWEQWLDKQCEQSNFTELCPNLLHKPYDYFALDIKLRFNVSLGCLTDFEAQTPITC